MPRNEELVTEAPDMAVMPEEDLLGPGEGAEGELVEELPVMEGEEPSGTVEISFPGIEVMQPRDRRIIELVEFNPETGTGLFSIIEE